MATVVFASAASTSLSSDVSPKHGQVHCLFHSAFPGLIQMFCTGGKSCYFQGFYIRVSHVAFYCKYFVSIMLVWVQNSKN